MAVAKEQHEQSCLQYFLDDQHLSHCYHVRIEGRWSPARKSPDFLCVCYKRLFVLEVTRLVGMPMDYEGLEQIVRRHIIPFVSSVPGVFMLAMPRSLNRSLLRRVSQAVVQEINRLLPTLNMEQQASLHILPQLVIRRADAAGRDRIVPWITEDTSDPFSSANMKDLKTNFKQIIDECRQKLDGFEKIERILLIDCSRGGVWEPL